MTIASVCRQRSRRKKQALDAADVREHDRAATLKDTLAQIEALKRQTQTPAQVLRDLPKFLTLPQPITLNPPQSGSPATQQGTARSKTAPCVAKKGCPSPVPPSSSVSSRGDITRTRIPCARRTNKPARPPRCSLRADPSRRTKTSL